MSIQREVEELFLSAKFFSVDLFGKDIKSSDIFLT